MKLPNAEHAVVEERKVAGYLLDPTNPRSGGKPTFFFAFGFSREDWQVLASTLREHVVRYDIASAETTEHGVRYVIVGALATPEGRNPTVARCGKCDARETHHVY